MATIQALAAAQAVYGLHGGSGSQESQREASSERPPESTAVPKGKPLYYSPVIRVDAESGLVLMQFRDKQTGELKKQIPSEVVVDRYKRLVKAEGESRLPKRDALAQAKMEFPKVELATEQSADTSKFVDKISTEA